MQREKKVSTCRLELKNGQTAWEASCPQENRLRSGVQSGGGTMMDRGQSVVGEESGGLDHGALCLTQLGYYTGPSVPGRKV